MLSFNVFCNFFADSDNVRDFFGDKQHTAFVKVYGTMPPIEKEAVCKEILNTDNKLVYFFSFEYPLALSFITPFLLPLLH